ncbi:hypothetical protein [Halobellus rubicundus]|uniref:Uncharacterized protein n=1 Tax=Halobellus rubicundus TaxID=2996466 RepID=A0ABD5MI38_9EURY
MADRSTAHGAARIGAPSHDERLVVTLAGVTGDTSSRTVNESLLAHLQSVLGRLPEVAEASLFPRSKQETLLVALETAAYPDAIETVRLEIRAYTNGEFHISYLERYLGERRQCRWDRHEQDHNSRDHFHPLPDASTAAAEDRSFPLDLTAVLRSVVFPWVEERFSELWDGENGR